MFIDCRERGRGREREKHGCEKRTSIGCLLYVPRPWNEPSILLVHGTMPQPTEHPARAEFVKFKCDLLNHLRILKK